MQAKTKLIATLMAMCLVITLGVFGIFAVKTLNMSVGGNITFTADGISFEVSAGEFKTTGDAEYANIYSNMADYDENNPPCQGFSIDTNTKQSTIQSKIDSWTNLQLALDNKGDAVLHFSVKNNMTTPLYVYVATNLGTNTNNNMDLIVSPNGTKISANATTNFTITFDIIDMNINAGLAGFEVSVDFAKESMVKTQNKLDPETGLPTNEVDYYYIEMGTYNGQLLRWRYVADSNGTIYDGTSTVSSLSGYYVLETYISIRKSFLANNKYNSSTYKHTTEGYTNINANDYGISDIRAYLTNTGNGGFMESLGITSDNMIYQMIKKRSVADLYSAILGNRGDEIDKTNTSYSLSLTGDKDISTQSDKFWLLSEQEALTFFADQASRVWGEEKSYFLRSPYPTVSHYASFVYTSGKLGNNLVTNTDGIRPAFKI